MDDGNTSPPRPRRTIADRYELLELLGSGGMGRVWRAHDTRLKRTVAIKTLNAAGAKANKHLLEEAQAQARVEHPGVCRIYEVGWDEDGEPFIVMQLVEGRTLGELAPGLSYEQRATALAHVAEAVHAAHRLGVIHRDLKPGNVLLEPTGDGAFKAFVTDFGLARDATASLESRTGSVVGTPQYMAPEQARGETARIDRRSDVYGLGATLYEALGGRMPFEGNAFEVLNQVLQSDPTPLRKLQPSVPRDLAVIVGKCMEKDPERRYDSARALAEDLQRWLDGRPILARPPGRLYLLRRGLQRHRAAVAGALVAAAVAGVALAAGGRSRARAREVAARFGQDVKEIEGLMRFALVVPLHDTSAEEAQVRARMARLAQEMVPLGREGAGPGNYALGRGSLALGEFEAARRHFELAWEAGYRTPETATGLGLALVELYGAALREAGRGEDPALRARRRRELERTLRAQALQALRDGAGATTEPGEYVEALVRFCDEDLDGAEAAAREAVLRAPWLYEARILLGRIHRERGQRKRSSGDEAGAAAEYQAAHRPLELAVQFGRSDPRAWNELCALWMDEVTLPAWPVAQEPAQMFAACKNAIAAAPQRPEPWVRLATAHRVWAAALGRAGREEEADELVAATSAARRALDLRAADPEALLERGLSLKRFARLERELGRDPEPSLDKAIDALQQALETNAANGELCGQLGAALLERAELLYARGRDPSGSAVRASQLLERALALEPELWPPRAGLGRLHALLGEWRAERGEDPRPDLARAAAAWREAEAGAGAPAAAAAQAGVLLQLAAWEEGAGRDPGPRLEEAQAQAVLAGPGAAGALARLSAGAARARAALRRGEDPSAALAAAKAAGEELAEPRPREALLALAETEGLQARWLARQPARGPVEARLARARDLLARALEQAPLPGRVELRLGELELLAGRLLAQRGASPAEALGRALRALERAAPDGAPRVERARAELHLERAAWLKGQRRSAGAEVEAGLRAVAALRADPDAERLRRGLESLRDGR